MAKIIVSLPDAFSNAAEGLLEIHHEEDAITWLWAYPSLVPWPRPLTWVYTPVVGKDRWPGDLWGLDSVGNLLIFECKQCQRSGDPFEDFLPYHRFSRAELSASHWREKFAKHFRAELCFPGCLDVRPYGKTAGMLPRSNKRAHLRRWPELGTIIDANIRSPLFETAVAAYLDAREKAGEPAPYYFGLMVPTKPGRPILTEAARQSARALQALVDQEHVGVIVLSGTVTPQRTLRLAAEDRSDLLT
jgi:hypothetical protein